MDKLLAALKRNRHGHRDWLIGLTIYRHDLRVSDACDLRWDDIDLPRRAASHLSALSRPIANNQ
jgi:integrase